jgi:PBP1b-binding outer membrane lipoprotein LpoB
MSWQSTEHKHYFTSLLFVSIFFATTMKRLCATFCSALLLSSGAVAVPATAKSSQCNRTLQTVKSQLTNVQKFQTGNLTSSGEPRPKGRSQELNIAVDSGLARNDEKVQLTIAKKVIANCSKIGLVTFTADGEKAYGLLNGKVQAFECKNMEEKVKWGEYICI